LGNALSGAMRAGAEFGTCTSTGRSRSRSRRTSSSELGGGAMGSSVGRQPGPPLGTIAAHSLDLPHLAHGADHKSDVRVCATKPPIAISSLVSGWISRVRLTENIFDPASSFAGEFLFRTTHGVVCSGMILLKALVYFKPK